MPQEPPWPEHRSITATSASGSSRSISAAFCPMFCARAWQASCTVTPPSSGDRPGARPSFPAISTMYSVTSKVPSDSFCYRRITRKDQWPLEFEHQRAGRHQRDHVVALVDPRAERAGDPRGRCGHNGEVSLLELRHAAAFRIQHLGLDPVRAQNRAGRLAYTGIVVVDEAGGVEHGLAAEGRRGRDSTGGAAPWRAHHEGLAVEFRQRGIAVDACELFEHRPGQPVAAVARPVGERRDQRRRACPLRSVLASSRCRPAGCLPLSVSTAR